MAPGAGKSPRRNRKYQSKTLPLSRLHNGGIMTEPQSVPKFKTANSTIGDIREKQRENLAHLRIEYGCNKKILEDGFVWYDFVKDGVKLTAWQCQYYVRNNRRFPGSATPPKGEIVHDFRDRDKWPMTYEEIGAMLEELEKTSAKKAKRHR